MQRYFLELAYKGTNYSGWQVQPNAITVQQKLNESLSTLCGGLIETTGCGRTDTGVHASKFFAHFDINGEINDSDKLIYQLNALLPHDIAIFNLVKVTNEAHARFDALSRTYIYYINTRKNPFLNQYAWYWRALPDADLMNAAASLFLDHKDFTCFSKLGGQQATNNCTITEAKWSEKENHIIKFTISANRFLRGMVRAIVGTLILVGQSKITLEEFNSILQNGNRSDAGESVPAHGLFLADVQYAYINGGPENLNPFLKS